MKRLVPFVVILFLLLAGTQAAKRPRPNLETYNLHWQCMGMVQGSGVYAWYCPAGFLRNNCKDTFSRVIITCSVINKETGIKAGYVSKAYLDSVQPGDKVRWRADPAHCIDTQELRFNVFRIDKIEFIKEGPKE